MMANLDVVLVIATKTNTCELCNGAIQSGERIEYQDRKSTRLNSSHLVISYAVFCLKKKTQTDRASPYLHQSAQPAAEALWLACCRLVPPVLRSPVGRRALVPHLVPLTCYCSCLSA